MMIRVYSNMCHFWMQHDISLTWKFIIIIHKNGHSIAYRHMLLVFCLLLEENGDVLRDTYHVQKENVTFDTNIEMMNEFVALNLNRHPIMYFFYVKICVNFAQNIHKSTMIRNGIFRCLSALVNMDKLPRSYLERSWRGFFYQENWTYHCFKIAHYHYPTLLMLLWS